MNEQVKNTRPGSALENWFGLVREMGIFMPLEMWAGSLGQGLHGHVQSARTGALADTSSAYSGCRGYKGKILIRSQGVKPDYWQHLTGLVVGQQTS